MDIGVNIKSLLSLRFVLARISDAIYSLQYTQFLLKMVAGLIKVKAFICAYYSTYSRD